MPQKSIQEYYFHLNGWWRRRILLWLWRLLYLGIIGLLFIYLLAFIFPHQWEISKGLERWQREREKAEQRLTEDEAGAADSTNKMHLCKEKKKKQPCVLRWKCWNREVASCTFHTQDHILLVFFFKFKQTIATSAHTQHTHRKREISLSEKSYKLIRTYVCVCFFYMRWGGRLKVLVAFEQETNK